MENTAIIIAPTEIIEYHSFTHELLHIYLDFLGLSTLEEVIHSIVGEYAFSFLLNTDLTSWIYNFSSHKKMFPFYKSMGFSEENFVQESISFTKRDLIYIKDTSKSRKTICESIDQFIGHAISGLETWRRIKTNLELDSIEKFWNDFQKRKKFSKCKKE